MKVRLRLLATVLLTLTASFAPFGMSTALAASTLVVGNDPAQCPTGTYTTIQAAVTAAMPGDTILVCSGTYPEQVMIPSGKDNLVLKSKDPLSAIIQAPAVLSMSSNAIVEIMGSHNVTVQSFTITGPGPAGCNSLDSGVRVDGNSSAKILGNHITQIRDEPFSGCQNGLGVLVLTESAGQVTSATITSNLIDNYQKGGIVVDGTGVNATIQNNTLRGIGPTGVIGQNGIQVSDGATAKVSKNRVSDHFYTGPTYTVAGILLYQAGKVTADQNTLRGNQDGVDLYTITNATVAYNTIIGRGQMANTYGDGIYAAMDASSNLLLSNYLRNNTQYDCQDDSTGTHAPPAYVANYWQHDDGLTQNKPGLCRRGGADAQRATSHSKVPSVYKDR